MQRRLLRLDALAGDQHAAVGHASQDHTRHIAVTQLDRGERRIARFRPGQLCGGHLLRVGQNRAIGHQRQKEDAATIALGRPAWSARATFVRPAAWKQDRYSLFAAAEQIAVNLVQQAARQCDIDAAAEQQQDQPQNQDVPADQPPADAREKSLHRSNF